jgi:4-aminobutyrate aminotransferase / (S)-3-amino-2-methylpropionate transaminase / 5-aminovalerate transaminase
VTTPQSPRIVTEIPGPRSRSFVDQEAPYLAPGMQSLATLSGITVDHGEGSILEDVDGNRFIDLAAGICVNALGHAHPQYVKTLTEQIHKVSIGSFTTPVRAQALGKVASHTPAGLDKIQLYSGGTEAVEAALRLAKSYTKKYEFLSFWGGFHGKSAGSLAMIGDGTKNQLGPMVPGAIHAPYADCYRCPLKLKYPSCGIECADFARQVVKRSSTGALAAIIAEPMQGTAGNIIPPPEFLPRIREIAKENGALFIADEMITGFGRTGRWFGIEHSGVVPDIMTVGKALGGGFPVSGLISTKEITEAKPWGAPSGSSSSYGGNPMAGAAIYASMTAIEEDRMIENASLVGERMLARFRDMQERYEFIGDVRGHGLLIGIELVKDRHTKEPLEKAVTVKLFQESVKRGLISMVYAPHFRVNPPLSIHEKTAMTALDILDEVFAGLAKTGAYK